MNQQTIGRRLSAAREAIPASLYQASRDTKIRVDFLEAMERDDFDFVSGGLYVRGMLRSYVRWLGLDEATVMEQYDSMYESKPQPSLARMIAQPSEVVSKPKRPHWLIAGVSAAAILLVLSLIGVMGPITNPATPPITPEDPAVRPTGAPGAPSQDVVQGPTNFEGVNLKIQVIEDKCWIGAYVDGNEAQAAFQGTLVSGQERTFEAQRNVKLVIGNLGAVRIFLNGRDLGTPGELGKYATIDFHPETQSFVG